MHFCSVFELEVNFNIRQDLRFLHERTTVPQISIGVSHNTLPESSGVMILRQVKINALQIMNCYSESIHCNSSPKPLVGILKSPHLGSKILFGIASNFSAAGDDVRITATRRATKDIVCEY
jgi:hypothetical protein